MNEEDKYLSDIERFFRSITTTGSNTNDDKDSTYKKRIDYTDFPEAWRRNITVSEPIHLDPNLWNKNYVPKSFSGLILNPVETDRLAFIFSIDRDRAKFSKIFSLNKNGIIATRDDSDFSFWERYSNNLTVEVYIPRTTEILALNETEKNKTKVYLFFGKNATLNNTGLIRFLSITNVDEIKVVYPSFDIKTKDEGKYVGYLNKLYLLEERLDSIITNKKDEEENE